MIMKAQLSQAFYSVDQVACGQMALDHTLQTYPDLILLDISLPDINGVEVCHKLKSDPKTAHIPIILLTMPHEKEAHSAVFEAGADDFLTKPVDDVALLARVRSLLRASDTARELQYRGHQDAAIGFAESALNFEYKTQPAHIACIIPDTITDLSWKDSAEEKLDTPITLIKRDTVFTGFSTRAGQTTPDVFIIFADLDQKNAGLNLLPDLLSRPGLRHAAIIMVLPKHDSQRTAIALDLGASDILYEPLDPIELSIRIRRQIQRKRQSDQMRANVRAGLELALRDSLTGLHNRRYALHELDRILSNPGQNVGVMMLDLDHFKQINDLHGHMTGDLVLRIVAQRLLGALRSCDLLARMGGEEFLVALPDTLPQQALECGERLRHVIADTPIKIADEMLDLTVTLSIGIAVSTDDTKTAETLIKCADAALYDAKNRGRNRVVLGS
jgi:two-component system cell cycle response regulator